MYIKDVCVVPPRDNITKHLKISHAAYHKRAIISVGISNAISNAYIEGRRGAVGSASDS